MTLSSNYFFDSVIFLFFWRITFMPKDERFSVDFTFPFITASRSFTLSSI